MILGLRFFSK